MNTSKKLTSFNFARKSNFVFSETVTHEQFSNLNLEKKYIVEKNDYLITYKLNFLDIKENDIIFCNSKFIKDLFHLLNKVNNLKNIKIITHQTDLLVDEAVFKNKPKSVSEWYSINVGFYQNNLIPIPIGIANDYSPKNIKENEFKNKNFLDKELKLYVNFNENTNLKAREGLSSFFKNRNWAVVKNFDIGIENYISDLKNYAFVLCPRGNGIDTHRVWEAIYSGSVPVLEYHETYRLLKNLPILFVDSINNLTYEDLKSFYESYDISNYNLESLDIDYWINLISESQIDSSNHVSISMNKVAQYYFNFKNKIYTWLESKFKIFNYYVKKLFKIFKN